MQSTENKILLIGFMGAGKSSFLRKLQRNGANYHFVDLDQEILKGKGLSHLGELIESVGWGPFRQMEYDFLKDMMNSGDNLVIALGGGAFNENNQKLLEKGTTIWLNTPFDICFNRIKESIERPLVKLSREELQKLFNERVLQYKKCKYILNLEQIEQINSLKDLFSHIGPT
ncbi:MAG: shikimate kinase [Epsilonproteobacteria bacterium]|nr:MAG: shikimate kinase [Campylobacterota bacterium]